MKDLEKRDIVNAWKGFCYAGDHSYKDSKEWCEKLTIPFIINTVSTTNQDITTISETIRQYVHYYYKPYFSSKDYWSIYFDENKKRNSLDITYHTIEKHIEILNTIDLLKKSSFTLSDKPIIGTENFKYTTNQYLNLLL